MELYHSYTETIRHRRSFDGFQLHVLDRLLLFPPEIIHAHAYMTELDEEFELFVDMTSLSVESTS
jgi:hypothetical protein